MRESATPAGLISRPFHKTTRLCFSPRRAYALARAGLLTEDIREPGRGRALMQFVMIMRGDERAAEERSEIGGNCAGFVASAKYIIRFVKN